MPHDQDHGIASATDHLPGTNGTLVGTEGGAVVQKTFSTATTAGHIAQRDGAGDVQVPSTPGSVGAAASKGYVDSLISGHRAPVKVFRVRNDALNSPPGGEAAGDAFVVGPVPAGAWAGYTTGDIVEWNGAAWVLVLANVGSEPPDGTRVVVHSAGLGGSFAGQANNIGQYNATTNAWSFTVPNDGDQVVIVGESSYFENQQYVFDAVPGAWVNMGSATPHNSLSGLQGGTAGEYYHFTLAQHTELVRYTRADVACAGTKPILADIAAWAVGDRGMAIGTTGRIYWVYKGAGPAIYSVQLN